MRKSLTVIKSSIALPINGAERGMFERLAMLKELNWNSRIIRIIQSAKLPGYLKVLERLGIQSDSNSDLLKYHYNGIEVNALVDSIIKEPVSDYKYFSESIDQILKTGNISLLICNMRDFAALHYCTSKQCPSVFFMTENEFPGPQDLESEETIYNAYKSAKNVIVASTFLKQSLLKTWGIDARVFANAVNPDLYAVSKNNKSELITIFHPYAHKGIEVLLKIVSVMPEQNFLVMGGSGKEYRARKNQILSYPNIRLLPYLEDIREVLATSKLVLVPSIWEEAFSRVVIESLASGTPVIAFDRGGIREAGADAAQYIPFYPDPLSDECIDHWKKTILEVLKPEAYSTKVEQCHQVVLRYKEKLGHDISQMSRWFEELLASE